MFLSFAKLTVAKEVYALITVPSNVALSDVQKVVYAKDLNAAQKSNYAALVSLFDTSTGFLKLPFDDDDENQGFLANIMSSIRDFLANLFPGMSNNDDDDDEDEGDIEDALEDIGDEAEGFGEDVADEFDDMFTVTNTQSLPDALKKAVNAYKEKGYATIVLKIDK
jgi:hypothetical protein